MAESPYQTSLLKKRNLELIVYAYEKQIKILDNLQGQGADYSNRFIKKKKEMKAILEEIKPPFYDLTKIDEMKDPKIVVKSRNPYVTIAKMLFGNPWLTSLLTIASATVAMPFALLDTSLLEMSLVGSGVFTSMSGIMYALNCKKHGQYMKETYAFYSSDNKIFIPADKKEDLALALIHEYAHHALKVNNAFSDDKFVEDGVATASSVKVLQKLRDKDLGYAIHGTIYALEAIGSTLCMFEKIHDINLGISDVLRQQHKDNFEVQGVNYRLGSTLVYLAELEYGEEVYPELYKGNPNVLIT